MRKDNMVFFVSGLAFGVLVGYFLFQSLATNSELAPTSGQASSALPSAPERRLVDPQEVKALEQMAADNPEDEEVRSRIGTLYLESGQYEQAVAWFREAVELKGDDLHLRNHMALALVGVGRIDEAISEYRAALAVDPSHPQSLFGLGRVLLYGKNDIQRGLEVWEKLVEVAPSSAEARAIREDLEALKSAHSGS
jgi:tetratricopeptide (TPR) repeat protein